MIRFSLTLLFLTAISSFAGTNKFELPVETGSFRIAPGSEIANGQCLSCHSVEYVSTQPPFPRAIWAGSVKKMREKYGAAIPNDQVEPLLDYLTQEYGVSDTNALTTGNLLSKPQASSASSPSMDSVSLAWKYGCFGCHNYAVKIVGPAYKEIAAKYQNDAEAKAKIAEQIQKGGSGKWGPVIMPPFPQVNEAEVKILTDWILGQKEK